MTENEVHARLVGALLGVIQQVAPIERLYIWADEHQTREHSPTYITGSVRADVIAKRKDNGLVIIGEAKSHNDIDNPHTHKQLKDYYEHLLIQPRGLLWLSVPMGYGGEAMRVGKAIRRAIRCERIELIVSEWLLGPRDLERRWNG